MSKNALKKMIVFSSDKRRRIIEGIINDEAETDFRSASSLIEKHLMDSLLPPNGDARAFVEDLYAGTRSFQEIVCDLFAFNAAGIEWSARHTNFLPLVEFVRDLSARTQEVHTGQEIEWTHFIGCLESVCTKTESYAKETGSNEAAHSAARARELYDYIRDTPQAMIDYNYYNLVVLNWVALGNYTFTFRMLANLAKMNHSLDEQGNLPEIRFKFVQILRRISADW